MTLRQDALVTLGTQVTDVLGIDNTGVTDVAAAVQSIVESASNKIIDFGGGTFRINTPLVFTGLTNVTLKNGLFINDVPNDSVSPPRLGTEMWRFNSCTNLTVDNIDARGYRPVGANGVGQTPYAESCGAFGIYGGSNITFQNCEASWFYGDMFRLDSGADRVTIADCTGHNLGRHGFTPVWCSNVLIDRFTGYDIYHWHFDFEPLFYFQEVHYFEIKDLSVGSGHNPYGAIVYQMGIFPSSNLWVHGTRYNHLGSEAGMVQPEDRYSTNFEFKGSFGEVPPMPGFVFEDNVIGAYADAASALLLTGMQEPVIRNNTITQVNPGYTILARLADCSSPVIYGNVASNLTVTNSGSGKPKVVAAKSAVDERGTTESGASLLMGTSRGIVYPDHLSRWAAALATAGSSRVTVDFIGGRLMEDSGRNGAGPTWKYCLTGWMRQFLARDYGGETSEGWLSLRAVIVGAPSAASRTGRSAVTACPQDAPTVAQNAPRPNGGQWCAAYTAPCTDIDVYYLAGTPAWTYTVDGGAPITRPDNPSGGYWDVLTISGLANKEHTLYFNGNGSTVFVGITQRTTTTGVLVNRKAASGDSRLVSYSPMELCGVVGTPGHPDLAVVSMGMLDWVSAIPVDTAKTNIQTFIDWQAAAGGCTLLLMDVYGGPAGNEANQDPYRIMLKRLAADNPTVAYFDPTAYDEFCDFSGSRQVLNAAVYWDNTSIRQPSHYRLATYLYPELIGV